jgi:hypothetical protein
MPRPAVNDRMVRSPEPAAAAQEILITAPVALPGGDRWLPGFRVRISRSELASLPLPSNAYKPQDSASEPQ